MGGVTAPKLVSEAIPLVTATVRGSSGFVIHIPLSAFTTFAPFPPAAPSSDWPAMNPVLRPAGSHAGHRASRPVPFNSYPVIPSAIRSPGSSSGWRAAPAAARLLAGAFDADKRMILLVGSKNSATGHAFGRTVGLHVRSWHRLDHSFNRPSLPPSGHATFPARPRAPRLIPGRRRRPDR